MREITSTILGFIAAAFVSGVLFAIFSYLVDSSGIEDFRYFLALLLIGLVFSAAVVIVLGVPTFILFRYFGLIRWWSSLAAGFAIGAFIGAGLVWSSYGFLPHDVWVGQVVRNCLGVGLIGAIAAFTFWVVWSRGKGNGAARIT